MVQAWGTHRALQAGPSRRQHAPLHRHVPALTGSQACQSHVAGTAGCLGPPGPLETPQDPISHSSVLWSPPRGSWGPQLGHRVSAPSLPPIEATLGENARLSAHRSVGFSWKLFHRHPSPQPGGAVRSSPGPCALPLPGHGSRQGTRTLYKPRLCGDRPSLAPLPAGVSPLSWSQ